LENYSKMLLAEEAITDVITEPNMSDKHVEHSERPRRTERLCGGSSSEAAVEVSSAVGSYGSMYGSGGGGGGYWWRGGFGGGRAVLRRSRAGPRQGFKR